MTSVVAAADRLNQGTAREAATETGANADPLYGTGFAYKMGWNRHDGARTIGFTKIVRRLPSLVALCARLSWRADRSALIIVVGCELISGAATAFGLFATSGVLRALLAEGPTPARVKAAIPAMILVGVFGSTVAILAAAGHAASGRLKPRVQRVAFAELLAKAVRVELLQFRQADYHDLLDAAQYGAGWAEFVIEELVDVVSATMSLIAAAGVLTVLHPALFPLLPLIALPRGWAAYRSIQRRNTSRLAWIPKTRRQRSLADLLAATGPAEEVRVHDAGRFLLGHYERLAADSEAEQARLARAEARTNLIGAALSGIATAATYALLGLLLMHGIVPLATAGTAVLAIRTGTSQLSVLISSVNNAFEYGLYVQDLDDACRTSATIAIPVGGTTPTSPQRIRAENLTFTYPNTDAPALDGVDLDIESGQVVALVGHNGSGKTTLAHVLTGLYLPDAGRVTWDGVPTTELDRDALFEHVAMHSQTFERWPFLLRANVAIGRHSAEATPTALASAAELAGATDMIAKLADGWDTLLAPEHLGGVDLSGGQWQKVGLARSFFRDAPILVLDEPTAALDPRAEVEVFERVRELAGGRTVLLISHRLYSVKSADRIFVMQDGRIRESGTHDQLMAAGGEYAELWHLQASQYAADEASQ
ncbi:ABC transporter ATP-binding protein [Catenulispora subtropica]|uniref:ABC transporter ATP-binding protein n=1 Tax=Catenulispora subtropica TaxID=450798 RepID=A0ABN2T872_9ACTN